MPSLALCPGCRRHVKSAEKSCPFCASTLCHAECECPPPTAPGGLRVGRIAAWAAGAALVAGAEITASGCSVYGAPRRCGAHCFDFSTSSSSSGATSGTGTGAGGSAAHTGAGGSVSSGPGGAAGASASGTGGAK